MTLKALLRRVQDLRGFVIKPVRLVMRGDKPPIDARPGPDPRRKRRCSCCGKPGRTHDKLPERRWKYVPLWGTAVHFLHAPRRVICPGGGPKVEAMPWSRGKHPYAEACIVFLARWARRLSWQETAEVFGASWDTVRRGGQGRLRGNAAKTAIKRGRFLLLKRGNRVRGKARAKLHAILGSWHATNQVLLTQVPGKACGVDVDDKTLFGALQHWYRFAGHGAIPVADQRPWHIFRTRGPDGATAAVMHVASGAEGNTEPPPARSLSRPAAVQSRLVRKPITYQSCR